MHTFTHLKAALRPLTFDPALDITPAEARDYRTLYSLGALPGQQHIGWLNHDGLRLATQYWLPQNTNIKTVRGTIVIAHGYYDHIGLYGHLLHYWLARDYAVIGMDMPGHGLSDGSPAAIGNFDEYGNSLATLLQSAQAFLPQPWTGVGQSMGCAVLMNYLMRRSCINPFCRLIFFAPLLRPYHWAISGRWIYFLLHRFIISIPRHFSVNSGDADFVRFVSTQDPLQSRRLSVAWVGAMKNWLDHFAQQPVLNAPTLIIQGEQDNTVDWRYNIPHIAQKLSQSEVHYLRRAHHHLVNESEVLRSRLWATVDRYCEHPDRRIPSRGDSD